MPAPFGARASVASPASDYVKPRFQLRARARQLARARPNTFRKELREDCRNSCERISVQDGRCPCTWRSRCIIPELQQTKRYDELPQTHTHTVFAFAPFQQCLKAVIKKRGSDTRELVAHQLCALLFSNPRPTGQESWPKPQSVRLSDLAGPQQERWNARAPSLASSCGVALKGAYSLSSLPEVTRHFKTF